jgi:hypothetical protein
MIPQPVPASPSFLKSLHSHPHLHVDGEVCPTCEQEIPPERLKEISGKIAAKQREQVQAVTLILEQQFAADKAEAEAKAKTELEQERQNSAARVVAERDEARLTAEAAAADKLAEAERIRQELETGLQEKVAQAEAARIAAEQAGANLQAQFQRLLKESQAALAAAKAEAEAKEAEIRTEVQQAADAALATKLAEIERARAESETALKARIEELDGVRANAEQKGINLQAQLDQLRRDSAAALEEAKAEARAKEAEIRTDAEKAAQAAVAEKLTASENARLKSEAALQARITEIEAGKTAAEQQGAALRTQLDELHKSKDAEIAKVKDDAAAAAVRIQQEASEAAAAQVRDQFVAKDQAVADAQAKSTEAESKLAKLAEQYDVALNERLGSQREILEKAKDEAVNVERAKAFEDTQKLQSKVSELQRALDNKTAEELGEGAEVNLYEALRKEFPYDSIERVTKGAPGADIHHVVMDHGRECGTIIYDSKNHKAFRSDHVAKLAEDQIAARAEHAILSLHKFPKGTGQLLMQDGVLLANPARVVAVVTLIRRHMVQTHTLRLSNAEREEKTARLYTFITSERCAQLLDRIEKQAGDLLELQNKEIRWHKNNWEKQGEACRAIQRAKADLDSDIHGIIGTAAEDAVELEDSEA